MHINKYTCYNKCKYAFTVRTNVLSITTVQQLTFKLYKIPNSPFQNIYIWGCLQQKVRTLCKQCVNRVFTARVKASLHNRQTVSAKNNGRRICRQHVQVDSKQNLGIHHFFLQRQRVVAWTTLSTTWLRIDAWLFSE